MVPTREGQRGDPLCLVALRKKAKNGENSREESERHTGCGTKMRKGSDPMDLESLSYGKIKLNLPTRAEKTAQNVLGNRGQSRKLSELNENMARNAEKKN